MSFLPQNYQAPKNSSDGYMKLQPGENKLRILSAPVIGWEAWSNNKPLRYKMDDKPVSMDKEKPVRHFWAMIVWNYGEEKIQILNITQATIRNCLEALSNDVEWGAPFYFDVKIIKSGEKMDVEYMVNPLPHRPVRQDIINAFNARPANLEALFDNLDPFDTCWTNYTPGVFSKPEEAVKEEIKPLERPAILAEELLMELESLIDLCDPRFRAELGNRLVKNCNITHLNQLSETLYKKVYAEVIMKKNEYAAFLKAEAENDVGF
jgi:hypothetical protein